MNAAPESLSGVARDVEALHGKGVRLWAENGELRYKAPKGSLTHEDLDRLRGSKRQIVALLESSASTSLNQHGALCRPRLDRTPLTYSQLMHWRRYRLHERPAIRQLVAATRLQGHLNIEALQRSAAEIVRRHAALRTRVVTVDNIPAQILVDVCGDVIAFENLSSVPAHVRDAEVLQRIEQSILQPVDVAQDPLFGMRLLKLSDCEHVLIIVMEHMISDACSMNILLRELFTTYKQILRAESLRLAEVAVQFIDYAAWQNRMRDAWMQTHGAFWDEYLRSARRFSLPADTSLPLKERSGRARVPVRIDPELKRALSSWARSHKTSLPNCMLD
jgi:hypothetical protein